MSIKSILKKAMNYFMTLLMLVSFTSCDEDEEYKTPDQLAKERQTEIMECFVNKDKETLKSFFSEYVINKYPDIDSQIDEAFNFLDGEIVSYDEPNTSASGPSDRKSYGGDTRNIVTTQNTEYRIIFRGRLTSDEEPEKIGVRCITVINMTESNKYANSDSEKEKCKIHIGEPM